MDLIFFTFPALITPAVVTVAILLLLVTNFSSFAATFVLRANDFPALSVSVPAGRLLTVMLFTTVFFAVAAVVAASAVPGTFIPENITPDGVVFHDYKTILQEIIQKNPEERIEYHLKGESGPDHNKKFTVQVLLNTNVIGEGTGRSKKTAEQLAAKEALELMGYGAQ